MQQAPQNTSATPEREFPAGRAPGLNTPAIPRPGESKETSISEPERIVIENINKAYVFFDEKPQRESLTGTYSPRELHIAPFTPYNATGNGEPALYRVFRMHEAKRRLLSAPWNTFALSDLHEEVPIVTGETASVTQGEMLLIPLPQGEEIVTLTFKTTPRNEERPAVTILRIGNRILAKGIGGEHAVSEEPITIGTTMYSATEKRLMTTNGKGRILEQDIHYQEELAQCAVSLVTVEEKQYMLLEGLEQVKMQISASTIERYKGDVLEMQSVEHNFGAKAFVSHANPEHPFSNEDTGKITKSGTGIVADGMGGHENGFFISRLAVFAMEQVDDAVGLLQDPQKVRELLVHELQTGHNVLANVQTNGDTTAAMGRVVKDKKGKRFGVWANVGDSRVYMYNPHAKFGERKLVQLSTDDNMLRRWERRAEQNNGFLTLAPSDPPLEQFIDFGFRVQGNSVYLEPHLMRHLRETQEATRDFALFSEGTLPLSAYQFRNISDGLRDGPGKDKPEEYHSGIVELPPDAELLILSDGASDTPNESLLVTTLESAKTPIEQARAITQMTSEIFRQHHMLLEEIDESEPDPMALQRVKPDDVTGIILGD